MSTARVISGPLQAERLPDGRRRLLRELEVDLWQRLDMQHARYEGFVCTISTPPKTVVTVPEGFDTDYSSVPAFARTFMGRWDKHDLAGVVHDYAYRVGVPRREADRMWWIVARSGKRHVNVVSGWLGWAGLRLGGWVAYRKRARERNAA